MLNLRSFENICLWNMEVCVWMMLASRIQQVVFCILRMTEWRIISPIWTFLPPDTDLTMLHRLYFWAILTCTILSSSDQSYIEPNWFIYFYQDSSSSAEVSISDRRVSAPVNSMVSDSKTKWSCSNSIANMLEMIFRTFLEMGIPVFSFDFSFFRLRWIFTIFRM